MGANGWGSIGRLIRVTAIALVLVLCCALGADARTPEQLQPGGAPAILSCSSIKKDPAVYRVARDSSQFARVHALWAIHAVHVDGNPKSVKLRKRPPTSVFYGLLHNLTSLARPSHTWAVASPADDLQVEITCPSSRGSHPSELLPARASTLWIPRSRRVSLFVGVLLLGGVTRFVYSRAFKPVVFVLALTIVSGMMADYFSRFVGLNRTHRTGPLFFASPYVALIALHLSNSRLDTLGNFHDADSLVQWVVIVLGLLLLGVYIALTIFLTRNFLFDNQQVNGVCQPLNVATIAVGQIAGILALANGSEDLFISAVRPYTIPDYLETSECFKQVQSLSFAIITGSEHARIKRYSYLSYLAVCVSDAAASAESLRPSRRKSEGAATDWTRSKWTSKAARVVAAIQRHSLSASVAELGVSRP